jgi:glycosyltransferase involved in cell wall biosynthesis
MKVAVVNNHAPFVRGGAELLAETLCTKLLEFGHDAELIRLPFAWHPPQKILEHMLAARLTRLENTDHVIALKFPAYYVEHDRKVLWLLHQFRQVYDLWGTEFQDLPDTPETGGIRDAVHAWDGRYLRQARRIYTNSEVTADRLRRFNGIAADVLYPPLLDSPELYRAERYGDCIFAAGRISDGKRQRLLVEAMKHVRSDVRLIVAGPPESPDVLRRLQSAADGDGRVEIRPRWLTNEEKQELFATALGCAYVPYDEDSYGYVTLESFHARKPVITCSDSGGVLTLVSHGETGLVADPDPHALAEAFDRLRVEPQLAEQLGSCAYERIAQLGIDWEHVIEELLR